MYQLQDLTTLFGVKILEETNANNLNNKSVDYLAIEQTSLNSQDSQNL